MSPTAAALLVVDDNEDNRYTLVNRLKRQGYADVVTANDGRQALELLRSRPFDLVLLDIMMPQQSGYDVCQRIRERPEWSGIRILMLSAKGREAEVNKGLSLGADLYITKPFSNAELVARIGELLGDSRAPRGA